jgi:hypothetical protein
MLEKNHEFSEQDGMPRHGMTIAAPVRNAWMSVVMTDFVKKRTGIHWRP